MNSCRDNLISEVLTLVVKHVPFFLTLFIGCHASKINDENKYVSFGTPTRGCPYGWCKIDGSPLANGNPFRSCTPTSPKGANRISPG